jgi:hypothetical protein
MTFRNSPGVPRIYYIHPQIHIVKSTLFDRKHGDTFLSFHACLFRRPGLQASLWARTTFVIWAVAAATAVVAYRSDDEQMSL